MNFFKFIRSLVIRTDELKPKSIRIIADGQGDEESTTILISSQSENRTIVIPDKTGTLSIIDGEETLLNKTIDADNNTISNLETDNFKTGVIVTSLSPTPTDTELLTAAGIKTTLEDYLTTDGSTPMTGNLDMNGFDVINVEAIKSEVQEVFSETLGLVSTTPEVGPGNLFVPTSYELIYSVTPEVSNFVFNGPKTVVGKIQGYPNNTFFGTAYYDGPGVVRFVTEPVVKTVFEWMEVNANPHVLSFTIYKDLTINESLKLTMNEMDGPVLEPANVGFSLGKTNRPVNNIVTIEGQVLSPAVNDTDIVNKKYFEDSIADEQALLAELKLKLGRATSTGVLNGLNITVNTLDNTKFDIAPGLYDVADLTDISNPIITTVEYIGSVGNSVTNIATHDVTYISLTSTGTIVQSTSFPNPVNRRQTAFAGRLNHSNRTSITFTDTFPDYKASPVASFYDLVDALAPFKMDEGLKTLPNGNNLSINTTEGSVFFRSDNYTTNKLNPHTKSFTAQTLAPLRYMTSTTSTDVSDVTVLDPAHYDVGGVKTAIPGGSNRATIQRVYKYKSGALRIQYGSTYYNNINAAKEALQFDTVTKNPTIDQTAVLIAFIIVSKGCIDLSSTSDCAIVTASRFGSAGGGAGGGGSVPIPANELVFGNATSDGITSSPLLTAIPDMGANTLDISPSTVGSGSGTRVTISSGQSSNGDAGNLNLTAKNGVGINRFGGTVNVSAGNSTGNRPGGDVRVTAGSGSGTTRGGDVYVTGGDSFGGGSKGRVILENNLRIGTTESSTTSGPGKVLSSLNYQGDAVWKQIYEDLDVFNQTTAENTEAYDFVTTGSANVTLTKDTNPLMGEAFKLTITSATGANLFSTRKGIDYPVPEEFRGQYVQLTYNYISDVAKGSICFEVTNLFDASTIVSTTELQAQPDATGVLTKGFIFFTVPQTASTIRIAMKRPSGAPDITAKVFWFNNIELKKFSQTLGPVITDPVNYTPTGSLTTNVVYSGWRVQEGKFLTQEVTLTFSGTNTQGALNVNLPSGLNIDTSLVNINSFETEIGITGEYRQVSATTSYKLSAVTNGTTNSFRVVQVFTRTNDTSAEIDPTRFGSFDTAALPYSIVSGDKLTIKIKVPIQGWSSTARYADYTLNQDVTTYAHRNGTNQTLSVNNSEIKILLNSIATDSSGKGWDTILAWDTTNSRYVSKVSGRFSMYGLITATPTNVLAAQHRAVVKVNSSNVISGQFVTPMAGSDFGMPFDGAIELKVGDIVELYLTTTGNYSTNNLTISGGSGSTYMIIEKSATSQQLFAPIGPKPFVVVDSGNYTIQEGDEAVRMTGSATASRTVTLPNSVINNGREILFHNNGSTHNLIIVPAIGENIIRKGVASTELRVGQEGSSVTLKSYGAGGWFAISDGSPRSIVKTYQSGASWYEVYSDGWVRQGAFHDGGATTGAKTISFLLTMKDTTYAATRTVDNVYSGAAGPIYYGVSNYTTSTFQVYTSNDIRYSKYIVEGYGNSAAVKALGANPNY